MRRLAIASIIFFCSGTSLTRVLAAPDDAYDDLPAEPVESNVAPQVVEVGAQQDAYVDTDPSALTDFRSVLDPYGAWVDDPRYGTVWIPDLSQVGSDFVPYQTKGRWAYDQDYTWISDYSWGWLPFHYGRWVFIPERGWAWIPGRTYAPAWVDWEVGDNDDYIGWAPMAPAWGWYDGVPVGLDFTPQVSYWYVPTPYLFDRHVHGHVLHGRRAREIQGHMHAYVHPVGARDHHPFAQQPMRGPPPAELGRNVNVVRVGPDDRGVTMARRYARPETARAVGGRPPSSHVVRVPPSQKAQPGGPTTPTHPTVPPRERTPRATPPEPTSPARPRGNARAQPATPEAPRARPVPTRETPAPRPTTPREPGPQRTTPPPSEAPTPPATTPREPHPQRITPPRSEVPTPPAKTPRESATPRATPPSHTPPPTHAPARAAPSAPAPRAAPPSPAPPPTHAPAPAAPPPTHAPAPAAPPPTHAPAPAAPPPTHAPAPPPMHAPAPPPMHAPAPAPPPMHAPAPAPPPMHAPAPPPGHK